MTISGAIAAACACATPPPVNSDESVQLPKKIPPTCSLFTTFTASVVPVTPTVSNCASFCRGVNRAR